MKTLLLVIDFINDIVAENGKIASCAAMVKDCDVMLKANEAIAKARQQAIPIVHVKVGFSADYIQCPEHSPIFSLAKKHCALELGTWGTEFHPQMDVCADDHIMIKHRISAYYATELATILDAQNIETVLVCGVATNMAIESTVRELHDRGFLVKVIANACAAANQEIHQASLLSLGKLAEIV